MQGFEKVGTLSELEPHGQFSRWVVQSHDILVYRYNGAIRAMSNVCPHFGGPVGFHKMRNGTFTCLWHNLQFSAETGQCSTVEKFKLRQYETKVDESGNIYVKIVEASES